MVIGIAILGAGTFAREAHLPAIRSSAQFELRAIYSLSQINAEEFGAQAGTDVYFDRPETEARSLDALLQRSDIEAVTVALPISVQPAVVRRALEADKHVLSEKPIAKDVETAENLLSWYNANKVGQVIWSVGENFRFWDPVLFAHRELQGLEGKVVAFSLTIHDLIEQDDKFLKSAWRRKPQHQGGIILDAGIHYVAALRMLLAAVGESITRVTAFTSLLQPGLAPKDTANATLKLSNGKSGTFNLSFGTKFMNGFEIQIMTDKGVVKMSDKGVIVLKHGDADDREKFIAREFPFNDSLNREIGVFAQGILTKTVEVRGMPQEALEDLKVMQAIIESGEEGGAVKLIR